MPHLPVPRLPAEDPCGSLVLAAIAYTIGRCAVGTDDRVRRTGAAVGGIVFLATVWTAVSRDGEVLALAVCSAAWAGLTVGTTWIVAALVAGVYRTIAARIREAQDERERLTAERRRAAEQRERQEAEARRQLELARIAAERLRRQPQPPPPPSKQDLLAQAKARYESTLRMLDAAGLDDAELTAARLRAKQQYLREIDEALR